MSNTPNNTLLARLLAALDRCAHRVAVAVSARWIQFRCWGGEQLQYWPALAYTLARAARAAGVGGTWIRARIRVFSALVARCAVALAAVLAAVASTVASAARLVWRRAIRPVARVVWGWVEQPLRDAGAWLVHTFPRLALRTLGRLVMRFARWLPVAVARVFRYAGIGAGLSLRHLGRYCVGHHDFAARIELADADGNPDRAAKLRHKWRVAAACRTAAVVLGLLAVTVIASAAVSAYGSAGAWLVLTVATTVTAGIGRAARPPRQPVEPDPAEAEAAEGAPFPLADAHTRAEAADATARALCAEGIELRMTGEVVRTRWGWEVAVMLRRGTPALITAKTGELETHLDLPAGGVLVTPDRARRAHVTLRLAQRDPFAGQPPAPYRPPRSGSITERAVIGSRIDGLSLDIPLLGVHGVVIGSPGSGKSTTLAALGDAISSCADATVWDLDPAGVGLDSLGEAVGRRERDPEGIEDALADALALAESRPRLLGQLGMGAAWQPDADRPAVVVIVDEYPRLTDRSKELAVALLRVGRKSRVTVILAATEATSDALGASIAELAALKILHSCRSTDVRLVLGPNMAAEGWRPDRLHPATADDPGDVGKCYVSTAGLREPLIAKVHEVDSDDMAMRASERAAAGVPRIDGESWHAARSRRAVHPTATPAAGTVDMADGAGTARDGERIEHQAITDILTAFGEDDRLWTAEILARLDAYDSTRYGQWAAETIALTLRPLGVSSVQIKREGVNRWGYRRESIAVAYRAMLGRP